MPTPSDAPTATHGLRRTLRVLEAADEPVVQSATIITTSDNPDMHEIHNRMPVILEKSTWEQWVNPGLEDLDELQSLLKPARRGPWSTTRSVRTWGRSVQRQISAGDGQRIAGAARDYCLAHTGTAGTPMEVPLSVLSEHRVGMSSTGGLRWACQPKLTPRMVLA